MGQYSVILRAYNNKGEKFDLELVDSPSFKLDISAIEAGDIGTIFGISSQQFALPGNDINNQFFNNLFDLGVTPAVGLNRSVPCQVLVDGESVYTGKLYVIDIITDQYNDVIYNCAVVNETIDFKTQVENRALADLDWSAYNHTFNYTNVSQSWNNNLFSGSVFYPLINYGADPNDGNSAGFEFGGARGMMDNPSTPLKLTQFKPAIKAKTIIDTIFDAVDYKYTSSFLNSDYFKSQYVLTTPQSGDGFPYINSVSQSVYAYQSTSQSLDSNAFSSLTTKMLFQTEVFDQGNNYNTSTSVYTAAFTGTHQIAVNIDFNITGFTAGVSNKTRAFRVGIIVNNVRVHRATITFPNAIAGTVNTGYVPINLNLGDLVEIEGEFLSNSFFEKFKTVTGQNNTWLSVIGPSMPYGGTVDIGKVFDDGFKILDFIKGLAEKFNLVIEPVRNERNLLKIETFNDWVDQGVVKDWSEKVDNNAKWKITHPVGEQPNSIYFSDDEDSDVLNQYQRKTSNNIYGGFNYLSNSDLSVGTKRIGGTFAATPVKGIPVRGNNGTTVLPWLCKQEQGKYAEPYKFKTRLLFQQPIRTINEAEAKGTVGGYSGYYFIDTDGAGNLAQLNYYRTLLPTTESPTDFNTSSDIHYTNIGYWPFQQSVVNGQCQDGLFNKFWAFYINELYDVDARKLTCNIKLVPSEIQGIQLNDKIFINGHYYRINKINGANLINAESVEVELLKSAPRKLPFTGRRRINTPTNDDPTQYKDVISNGFTVQGNTTYVDFETGEPVTDPYILSTVATLDGFEIYGSDIVWNAQDITRVNPSFFTLGNTKWDETMTNVMSVGSGNSIPQNTSNFAIFGDNNTITNSNESVTLIANDAVVNDSNFITLIQPSGSRIISGSFNNVFLNPINDITSADPTGSVYIGNLINQGTADFKNGASMTGSVNITGSFCVNGDCWPFGDTTGSVAATASFISAFDTTDQTIQGALTASVMTFNTVDFNRGVTLVSGSQFTIPTAGAYNLAFSAQINKTGGGGETMWIWLRKNGSDVANSNTSLHVPGGSNERAVAAWNFFLTGSASDYWELAWTATNVSVYIDAVSAVPGVYPAIPSLIATVNSMY
jgi:hypothetical protein